MPSKAKIFFKGHGWNVFNSKYFFKIKPVVFFIDKPGLNSVLDTLKLRKILERDLDKMKVGKIIVDPINLPFDKQARKWMHMKLDATSISIDKGYIRDKKINFEPESVLVTGPKSIVFKLKDTLKIRVPFQGLDKNFDESLNLNYYLNNPLLKLSHEKVKVKFNVRKRLETNGRE